MARAYYSTDNGSHWTEFCYNPTGETLTNVNLGTFTQIKFKLVSGYTGGAQEITDNPIMKLSSDKLGMSISFDYTALSTGEGVISDNYTLTQTIDDIIGTNVGGYTLTIEDEWSYHSGCIDDDYDSYLKVNSAPTSSIDYDYCTTGDYADVIQNVKKYYYWTRSNYSNATEVTMTRDTTVTLTASAVSNGGYGPCCFLPNTQVNTNNGLIAIENIQVGDLVKTYNLETKKYSFNKVTRFIKNTNITELATLILEDNTQVQFNSYHPILTNNGWKSLTNFNDYPTLTDNDVLVNNLKIKSIKVEILNEPLIGYNLVVENNNNFVVENNIVAEGGK